ncbi:MAG: type II toxin-antitoxin system HicA family toxin [Candidatus Paceibacterales bacterium]
MPKLPVLTAKKIIKLLKNHGFVLDHVTGSHYIFYNSERDRHVTVPYHGKDLPKGTLLAILDQAGLDRKDLF